MGDGAPGLLLTGAWLVSYQGWREWRRCLLREAPAHLADVFGSGRSMLPILPAEVISGGLEMCFCILAAVAAVFRILLMSHG